jgi:hypothetical protein
MSKPEKYLMQIRLSDSDRRRIKSLAAKQGLTLQEAVVEAFAAWSEKLRGRGPDPARTQAPIPKAPADDEFQQPFGRPSWTWLSQAVQLDWSKCPEVEFVGDGTNHLWMFRESDAPLSEVLGALADGVPAPKVAEIFELDLLRLAKVMEFAATPLRPDALN